MLRIVEYDIQKQWVKEVGFVDIVVKDCKCPVGPWPAEPDRRYTGQLAKAVLETDIEG